MTVGASTVASPGMAARWAGSEDPAEPVTAPESRPETWGEKAYAALPLFIVGGACLAVAIDFYASGSSAPSVGNSSVHLAPWALFLALAVTGLGAGVFAMFMGEEEPAPAEAPVEEAITSAPAAPWDESTLTPANPSYARPRTWEQRHPVEAADLVGWPPAEPQPVERVSPDVVLVQIDEIAASLRKKSPPSKST